MSGVSNHGLNGAVVLVTGAYGDIGRVACAALTDAGARVIGSGRGSAGDDLRVDAWMRHDVTCADDWTRIAEEIRLRFGRLDCLVNAAGVSMVESIVGISIEQWRHAMAVNVESVLRGLQALLPLLRQGGYKRPGGSSVVNISSVAGVRGVPFNGKRQLRGVLLMQRGVDPSAVDSLRSVASTVSALVQPRAQPDADRLAAERR